MKHVLTRFFPVLLVFALAAGPYVNSAEATAPVPQRQSGEYTYTIEAGQATITRYTGSESHLTIPDRLDGYPVTAIGDEAFRECRDLTYVTIPDGVLTIGEYAFIWCENLAGVSIAGTVTDIGAGAFWGCSGLAAVTLPDSVTNIGDFAFFGCVGLTGAGIPASVTSIGLEAFDGCDGLALTVISGSAAQQYARENGIPHTVVDTLELPAAAPLSTAILSVEGNTAVNAGATLILRVETSADITRLQLMNEDKDEVARQNKWLAEGSGTKTWELTWTARGSKNRTLTVRAHGDNGYADEKVAVTVSGSAPSNQNPRNPTASSPSGPGSRPPGAYPDAIIGPPR